MENKTIITIDNQKNTATLAIAKVVELGKITELTLGGGSGGTETRKQPFGLLMKK